MRSIPPANRQPLLRRRLSSMQAATRTGLPVRFRLTASVLSQAGTQTGYIFVGGQNAVMPATPSACANADRSTVNSFQPRIVHSGPLSKERVHEREIYYKALRLLAEKLEELITVATEPGEIEFWQQQLERQKGFVK